KRHARNYMLMVVDITVASGLICRVRTVGRPKRMLSLTNGLLWEHNDCDRLHNGPSLATSPRQDVARGAIPFPPLESRSATSDQNNTAHSADRSNSIATKGISTIDVWLETSNGGFVVDHKSFPGRAEQWSEQAIKHAPQLFAYGRALEMAGHRV